jgi:hypothetical protein
MRTSLRATIAIALALGALIIASVASASPPPPSEAVPSATQPPSNGAGGGGSPGTPGMTCAITNPNCNDRGFGGDPSGPPTATPSTVSPTPGMVNVMPTTFDTATIGDDGVTLTIRFWSGFEPCSVLDHVDVAYATDAVTVTLFQGNDPTADNVACPDIAVLKQTTITLDQPLAGRSIVDGATS